MLAFADRTGITSGESKARYLWTDAFAVCNFLGLARATGDPHHAELAFNVPREHCTMGVKSGVSEPRAVTTSRCSPGSMATTTRGLTFVETLHDATRWQSLCKCMMWSYA